MDEDREEYVIKIDVPKGFFVQGWVASVTGVPIDDTGDGHTLYRYDGGYALGVGLSSLLHQHMLDHGRE